MPQSEEKRHSLASLLNAVAIGDLQNIRKAHAIPGASQFKKAELVQLLAEYLLEHLDSHLSRIDQDRYEILMKVLRSPDSAMDYDDLDAPDEFEPAYYQQYGLLFLKKDTILMPAEIRERLLLADTNGLKAAFKRNEEWIRLSQGLLFYYGYMPTESLIAKVEQYTGKPIDLPEFQSVIDQMESYDYSICKTAAGYAHYQVPDPEQLDAEQRSRPDLDYYPLTKAEALRASADEYADRHPAFVQFVNLLRTNWQMGKEDADVTVIELVGRIQQGDSPSDLIGYLQEDLEMHSMEVMQKLVDALMALMNHTHLWDLKGHAPNEVFKQESE